MKSELRQKAIDLRIEQELSYSEIKKRLKVSKSTLSYWLKDYPLTGGKILELRRAGWSKGEASREKYRATMRQKKVIANEKEYFAQKKFLSKISDDAYFVSGLMLYLAEGAKKKDGGIVLANTDSRVIKFFIKWMEKFLTIPVSTMRIQLHLYEDMELEKEKEFWRKTLGLKNNQIYKLSVRKLKQSSFSYSESYRHGTCSLYAFGVEPHRKLMMAMKAFVDLYLAK